MERCWLDYKVAILLGCFLYLADAVASADDWPMWRYDAQRSAASPNTVPAELQLLWERRYDSREQAWDDPLNLDLMTYDRVFEPIVLDGRLFVGFNDRDKLLALDAETGQELWSAYAEAPVRLPPVGWQDRVFFCSDDGYLYCVNANDGELIWKFSGAPTSQHAIGNRRLTSAWPARGGPVVRDGTVYFAASIWPFMGTFIYALNAQNGQIEWINDRTGAQYIKQPHSAPSFAGVAPQGAMVATEDLLIVPGGRSVPAVFDRHTGELIYFEINAGGKGTGGSFVTADDTHFYVHTRERGTRAFELESGLKTAFMPNEPVLSKGIIYAAESEDGNRVVRAYDARQQVVWEVDADGLGDLILAGKMLIAAGEGGITLVSLGADGKSAEVVRTLEIDAPIQRLLVANQQLFAITLDGRFLAFGAGGQNRLAPDALTSSQAAFQPQVQDTALTTANQLLSSSEAEGYALWFGSSDSPVLQALVADSPFVQLAVVDHDAERVDLFRKQLDARDLYGSVTAHHSSVKKFRAPKFVVNMLFVAPEVVQRAEDADFKTLYEAVRPYGGELHLLQDVDTKDYTVQLLARIKELGLEQAEFERCETGILVRRAGALPGSADWTHQYGDVANSVKSDDARVRLPLGILWFGGSSNMDVLPRHGHGPPEQVIGGRLFIQGTNCLSARDVYTGRVLWKREFEDLGTFDVYFDTTYENTPLDPKYNQVHIPGANARGTNYVVTEDRVYLLERNVCHVLDPRTGETLRDIRMPEGEGGQEPQWGYIGVYKDVLIGGVGFAKYRQRHGLKFESDSKLSRSRAGFGSKSLDRAGSMALIGFDRHTGDQLWQVAAKHSFWHNGIVAGGGQIYCLDKNPELVEQAMLRRGLPLPDSYRIVALDYKTGKLNWQVTDGVFGTWLGYSEEHDKLLQAGAAASDRLYAETGTGMTVFDAGNGALVWKNDELQYAGPCILHDDLIITNANSYAESAGAFFIETGRQKMFKNPLTGEMQPWKLTRAYGCNNIIASENLLTFRSGAAGYYDLTTESGTGNLGGFKSGCTSNLVVANGVLNAPDYTRTCSCAYQNQTSLALVHMPDIEIWSVHSLAAKASPDQKLTDLAINFGAPGDRAEDSTLWLEYPAVAGDSPPFSITTNTDAEFFQHHSSTMLDTEHPWLVSSGIENLTDLRIEMRLASKFSMAETGLPVESPDDDAEESETGDVSLDSSDLELVKDDGIQTVGLRFNKLPLQQGTKIRSAHIQFTCDEPSEEPTTLFLAAEDTPNAAEFTNSSHDISSRSRTPQEVAWKPEPWKKSKESSDAQSTPDLSPLVQAVVDHQDWRPGNSMAFLISGQGLRTAVSSKGPLMNAPRLVVDADSVDLSPDVNRSQGQKYNVTLHFGVPSPLDNALRQFDVYAQGKLVLEDVCLNGKAKGANRAASQLLPGVMISDALHLEFVATAGTPVLSGIEIQLVD